MSPSCVRCHRPMHPAQGCRREPDGIICMDCHLNGPQILHYDPNHNRIVLVEGAGGGTVRVSVSGRACDDPRLN